MLCDLTIFKKKNYLTYRLGCHGQIPMVWIIMFLLGVGAISSTLMIPFWHKTATFNGSEHSIALFVLVFFLSLVDCTSSVLFLPFMGVFKEIYLNSYLVGEGMSGFVPSIGKNNSFKEIFHYFHFRP